MRIGVWVVGGLLLGLLAGCDDSGVPSQSQVSVDFITPGTPGALLGCADDLDRSTEDFLEYNVSVVVRLKGSPVEGLVARLRQVGRTDSEVEAPVPVSGTVDFLNYRLGLGDQTLAVEVVQDGTVVATSERRVISTFNPADPACGAVPTVRFTAPTDGAVLGGADDLNQNLADDLQVDVAVAIEGAIDSDVRLEINGAAAGAVAAVDGVARFAGVTLPIGDGQDTPATLAAVVMGGGQEVRTEITVTVAIDGCPLTIAPLPTGEGCDLTTAIDEDPGFPGIQVTFTAQTTCGQVAFQVGGRATELMDVVDGTASAMLTLAEGPNEIRATAVTAGGLQTDLTPYTLVVGPAEAPTLDLALAPGANAYTLADADPNVDAVQWTVRGTATSLVAGTEVRLALDPPVNPALVAEVQADGSFSFPVATLFLCPATARAEATDVCGRPVAGPVYNVCFDGVQPLLEIIEPGDGAFPLDADPAQPGVQTPVQVRVTDPRPVAEYDYEIRVECGSGDGIFHDRTVRGTQRSTADGRGVVVVDVAFLAADAGDIRCRATANPTPNPVINPAVGYRIELGMPLFTLREPPSADAPTCFGNGNVHIFGDGARLSVNAAQMTATLVAQGQPPQALPLSEEGPDQYGLTFGDPGQPGELPDGQYSVRVTGVSDAGAVGVNPMEAVPFIVDGTPPVLALASLALVGAADDANNDLSDCIQTRLRIQLIDATATRACYRINGGPETCGDVDENGMLQTDEVSLGAGDNLVSLRATDCAGHEAVIQAPVRAEGCGADERRLVITNPGDGEFVRQAQDADPAVAGCQIELRAGGFGFPVDADFVVCTDVPGAAGPAACGGESSPNDGPCVSAGGGGQNLSCPISLTDGTHRLRVVSTGRDGTASPPITVRADCTAPTVVAIAIDEDDDGDGCINRQERIEDLQNGGPADVTVRFQVEGIEDGRGLSVRRQPENQNLGIAVVNGGVGSLRIRLGEGDTGISIQGTDDALNPLPPAGGANFLAVVVDTTAPTPALADVVDGQCFNAAADVDAADGLQIGVQVRTGRQVGETVTVQLATEAEVLPAEATDQAVFTFPVVDVPQGEVGLVATVTDTCGNVGSVSGFEQTDGQDDWGAPIPVSIRGDALVPSPTLLGVEEGRIYTLADDADADASNGLQVAVQVFFPGEGAEPGQIITIRSGMLPLATEPAPLLAAGALAVDALLTLPEGANALNAQVTDTCGNAGASAVVNVRATTGGCGSAIVGIADPALGPGDGVVVAGGLQLDIAAQVDVLCAVGTAQLVVDNRPVGAPVLVGLGNLVFADVVLATGAHLLSVRVTLAGLATDSAPLQVFVDLDAPTVSFVRPAGPAPVALVDDEDPAPGQQVLVVANVLEDQVDTPREATLEIDGALVAGPLDVPAGSPVAVNFGPITVPAGASTLRVCATDAAGNEGCAELAVTADPGPPGIVDPQVEIVDPRRPRLRFRFVAPGDDGAGGGRVTRYRLRQAATPIVTEEDWQAATLFLATAPTVDPGQIQVLNVTGLLFVNNSYHVAIRAVDEGGREGPWLSVPVDLTLPTATFDLTPAGGWGGDDFFNGGSLVEGLGDVDGDGRADLLVYGNRITGQAAAAVIYGAADPANGALVPLTAAPNTAFFATDGRGVGDVNGDGAPDFALLGYSPDFANTRVALYFGCPAGGGCTRDDVATPDVVLRVPGRVANFVAGVGDFFGPGQLNDLLIGGSPAGGGTTAFVIDGRANWPADLDVTALNAANGLIALEVPEANAGVFATRAGDLDGDGFEDLALTAGGGFEATYVFYGGDIAVNTLRFVDAGNRAVRLVNPCDNRAGTFGSWLRGGVDLTGNGRPDLLVGARSFKQIAVFNEDLQPLDCFGRAEVQFGVNFDFIGDVDRDGDVDLIVTHRDDQGRPQDAFLYANDGAGRFGGRVALPREPQARFSVPNRVRFGAAGVGDFNGDGAPDLATVYKLAGGALRAVVHY